MLAKSDGKRISTDKHDDPLFYSNTSATEVSTNTSDELSYDDYYEYEYDDDEALDQNEFGEEDEYLDDYAEPIDSFIQGMEPIRKIGSCPKVVKTIDECDPSKISQPECHFDTDCPDNQKCCEAACGGRVCDVPTTSKNLTLIGRLH